MIAADPGDLRRAPDFAEAIETWRVWRVVLDDGRYKLSSVFKPALWEPGEAVSANCLRSSLVPGWLRRRPRHEAPEESCECGIYGAGLDQLSQYLAGVHMHPTLVRVLGRVSLWGTVIECERGFRASFAYPLHVYVPLDAGGRDTPPAEKLARTLGDYGVPVELLYARGVEAARVLARRQLV